MNRLVSLLTVFSLGAAAQTVFFSREDDTTATTYTYGNSGCTVSLPMRWTNRLYAVTNIPGNPFTIWATESSSCGNAPEDADVVITEVANLLFNGTRTGVFNIDLSTLPGHLTATDGGTSVACPSSTPATKKHQLCGSVEYLYSTGIGGTTQYSKATAFALIYDTEPPGRPTIVSFHPQDSAVDVTFSVGSDTTRVTVEVMAQGESTYRTVGEALVANTSNVRGTGLSNGVQYLVRLRAYDGAGNLSDPSDAVEVAPIDTIGLYGYWAANGGDVEGGCNAAPALLPLMFAALVWRGLRRKKQ